MTVKNSYMITRKVCVVNPPSPHILRSVVLESIFLVTCNLGLWLSSADVLCCCCSEDHFRVSPNKRIKEEMHVPNCSAPPAFIFIPVRRSFAGLYFLTLCTTSRTLNPFSSPGSACRILGGEAQARTPGMQIPGCVCVCFSLEQQCWVQRRVANCLFVLFFFFQQV